MTIALQVFCCRSIWTGAKVLRRSWLIFQSVPFGVLESMWILASLIVLPAAALCVPALVLFAEVVAGVTQGSEAIGEIGKRLERVAVVVPAHDEGAGLLPTLTDLQGQMVLGDRLIVVADNCADDTAAVAADTGAEVLVRQDAERVGKGYALSTGIAHLANDPPDFVLFCDADCRVEPGLVSRLAAECARYQRPIQACYLMTAPVGAAASQAFAEFAWSLKNLIRPLGLRRLGGPCQLMGTGMMFPWNVIRDAPLASGNLVEDLQLGLDLALKGTSPLFMPYAVTTSVFPTSIKGAENQRKRWVQGHLATITAELPRLLGAAIRRSDLNLVALALDVAVPPLVLLTGLTAASWCLAFVAVICGIPAITLLPATLCAALVGASVSLAWLSYGRAKMRGSDLSLLARQIWSKSKVYFELAHGNKAGSWIRAERARVGPSVVGLNPNVTQTELREEHQEENLGAKKIT